MLRKVAVAAASKPHVEIRQDGDQFYIKTSTTVRTTEINFKVGEGFEEETVDGRKCRVSPEPGGAPRAARAVTRAGLPPRGPRRASPAGRVCRRLAEMRAGGCPRLGGEPCPSLPTASLSRLPRCPQPRRVPGGDSAALCGDPGRGRRGSRRWQGRRVSCRR